MVEKVKFIINEIGFKRQLITDVSIRCGREHSNKVNYLPVNLFNIFMKKNVTMKRFSLSYCVDFHNLEGNEFKGAVQLTALRITHTSLKKINQSTFDDLKNVYQLDLSFNKIEELYRNTFQNMKNLIFLKLSHNSLRSFHNGLVSKCENLYRLWLDNNNIDHIDFNQLMSTNIHVGDFRNNTCINEEFNQNSTELLEFLLLKIEQQVCLEGKNWWEENYLLIIIVAQIVYLIYSIALKLECNE